MQHQNLQKLSRKQFHEMYESLCRLKSKPASLYQLEAGRGEDMSYHITMGQHMIICPHRKGSPKFRSPSRAKGCSCRDIYEVITQAIKLASSE